jgi:hypothetical protein
MHFNKKVRCKDMKHYAITEMIFQKNKKARARIVIIH